MRTGKYFMSPKMVVCFLISLQTFSKKYALKDGFHFKCLPWEHCKKYKTPFLEDKILVYASRLLKIQPSISFWFKNEMTFIFWALLHPWTLGFASDCLETDKFMPVGCVFDIDHTKMISRNYSFFLNFIKHL